ncbi:MAG: hypothetical protein OXF68_05680, partial [Gammaproteobacteria bacterium]|nr:hypothetical protein [Gammaproteobacteria bacterium]
DERSPHVHILLTPIVRHMDGLSLGINAVKDSLAAPPVGLQKLKGKHRDSMSRMQDAYYEQVGQRFGLERGEKGSQKSHEAVDVVKAAQLRADDMQAKSKAVAKQIEEEAQAAAKTLMAEVESNRRAHDLQMKQLDARQAAFADWLSEVSRLVGKSLASYGITMPP